MYKLWSILSLAVLLVAAVGCSTTGGGTNLFCPGSAAYQQRKAERFDPYAERELGPDIAGARPRDYDRPIAEPARVRWLPWNTTR